jgi:ribonuclease VapC
VVIDSSALITIVLKEPDHELVLDQIANADVILIGAPTLLETAIVLSGRLMQDARPMLAMLVRRLHIQVVGFTEDHYEAASDAFLLYGKGLYPAALNFGDCMTYAVAKLSGLPLLYTGGDFSQTDIMSV